MFGTNKCECLAGPTRNAAGGREERRTQEGEECRKAGRGWILLDLLISDPIKKLMFARPGGLDT